MGQGINKCDYIEGVGFVENTTSEEIRILLELATSGSKGFF